MKKIVIILMILLLVASLASFVLFKINKLFESQTKEQGLNLNANEIAGIITEVKKNSIIVEVKRGFIEGKVEVIITPETVLKNHRIIFPKEQIQGGNTFKPKTETRTGEFSDFRISMGVDKITLNQDSTESDKVTAVEINYLTYEFLPTPTQ